MLLSSKIPLVEYVILDGQYRTTLIWNELHQEYELKLIFNELLVLVIIQTWLESFEFSSLEIITYVTLLQSHQRHCLQG